MKIAICDDEKAQIGLTEKLILNWSVKSGQLVEIHAFSSAEEFFFTWSDDKSFDILFLDIQMKSINGIELAKTIRKSDDRLVIIFVTGFTDFVFQGYEVSALHYLIKPIKEEDLFNCLDRAKALCDINEDEFLLIPVEGQSIRVRLNDIKYAEVMAHYIDIHGKNEVYSLKRSISELEKELDSGMFFRCHRSFIISIRYIDRITKTDAVLDDGTLIPVSRQKWDGLNQAFINYYRRMD